MVVTPTILRRLRLWSALAGILALIWLAHRLYEDHLPAAAWLDRGWYAMEQRHYAKAEEYLLRAQSRAPQDDLPKLALMSLYWHEQGDGYSPPNPLLTRIPFLGYLLAKRDEQWQQKRAYRALDEFMKLRFWAGVRYGGFGSFGELYRMFNDHWKPYGAEIPKFTAAMSAIADGDFATGWDGLSRLEHDHPQAYAAFARYSIYVGRYYAVAAWRTGHSREADHLLKIAILHTPAGYTTSELLPDQQLLLNFHLTPTYASPARTWSIQKGQLKPVGLGQQSVTARLLLTPARDGAQLLWVPDFQLEDHVGWWVFSGQDWHERASAVCQGLYANLHQIEFYERGLANVDVASVSSTWSDAAEYFTIAGLFHEKGTTRATYREHLLRIDHGVEQISGQSPKEALYHHGDLWVRGDFSTARITPAETVRYSGNTVTHMGDMFTKPRDTRAACWIDNSWKLAHDKAGNFWLVSWDGVNLTPRARWDGAQFRSPTAPEAAQATGAFLDTRQRLWLAGDLPTNFQRDAWRHAPGIPPLTKPACYAVDRRGRVWVVCQGVAARWDGRWIGVANRLPGLTPIFDTVIAVDNGVLISQSTSVSYLD